MPVFIKGRCPKNGLCMRTMGYCDHSQCVLGTDWNGAFANTLLYLAEDSSDGLYHSPCDLRTCALDQISHSAPQVCRPDCNRRSNRWSHRTRSILKRLVHQGVCGIRSNNLMIRFFTAPLKSR